MELIEKEWKDEKNIPTKHDHKNRKRGKWRGGLQNSMAICIWK